MGNKKNKKTRIVIIFVMVILFLGIVNASLYDDLDRLKTGSCSLIYTSEIPSSFITDFSAKFSPGSNPKCSFRIDIYPYEDEVFDFSPWVGEYGEIIYNYDYVGDKETIVVLAKDASTFDNVGSFITNYENHIMLLTYSGDRVYLDQEYFDLFDAGEIETEIPVPPTGCSDNPNANIYTSNHVFYGSALDEELDPYCWDGIELDFVFCENNLVQFSNFNCDCIEGKCIANAPHVFFWIDRLGKREDRLKGDIVTIDIVNSAIKSWLDN